jgi:hypothetical protein
MPSRRPSSSFPQTPEHECKRRGQGRSTPEPRRDAALSGKGQRPARMRIKRGPPGNIRERALSELPEKVTNRQLCHSNFRITQRPIEWPARPMHRSRSQEPRGTFPRCLAWPDRPARMIAMQ